MKSIACAVAVSSLLLAANLQAASGNVILTGEALDYHAAQSPSTDPTAPDAVTELTAIVKTVRSGSPNPMLPVLILAQPGSAGGAPTASYLAQAMNNIGIPACILDIFQPLNCYIVVDPTTEAIPKFTASLYSAVGVASANNGDNEGDNSSQASVAINAASATFQSFIAAGGGVFGLSSKGNTTYYNFLTNAPTTYSILNGQPVIPGYPPQFPNGVNQATAEGLLVGIPANSTVNGYSLFDLALSPSGWQALETYTGQDTYYTYNAVTNQPLTVAQLQLMVAPPTSFAGATGKPFSGTLAAVRGFPPYRWQITGQPSWLTIDPVSGTLSGTPVNAGSYTFTATVTDSSTPTGSAQEQVTITVVAQLAVAPPTTFPALAGVPFTATLSAVAGVEPYAWQLSGQPAWLTINPATGVLSGTPPAAGFFSFTAMVADSAKLQATAQAVVSITVSSQLQIVPPTTFSAVVATPFSGGLSAVGGTPPYNWQTSGQPAWLSVNPATGVLSGTPPAAGLFTFTATVTDSGGVPQTIQAQISVTVAPQPLQIAPPTTFTGTAGVPFSAILTATGGTPPYLWQVSGQPAWLVINASTGALSGTPTAVGPFAFVVTVSDSGAGASLVAISAGASMQTAQASVTLTIAASSLVVPPTSAFAGTVGTPISGSLTATGGTPPYTWQATGLPGGLSLSSNGSITGTPTAAGVFHFTANVADSASSTPGTGSTAVTITVAPPYVPSDITLAIQTGTAQPTLAFSATNTSSNTYAGVLSIAPPNTAESPGPVFADSSARTLCFIIPANSSGTVTLPDSGQFSEGSVAGTLTINLSGLSQDGACSSNREAIQGGTDVSSEVPSPVMVTQTLQRSVPVITSVSLSGSASSGITVTVLGSSNTQELVSASFTFTAPTGKQLNGAEQTVSLSQVSSSWFSNSTYGGAFALTLTFPYSGSAASFPTGVSVVLVNSVGSSTPVTNSQ